MVEGEFYYVKGWRKVQHYHNDECPNWIKLYRRFPDDPSVSRLSEIEQYRWLKCQLVSAEFGGRLPRDSRYIARRLGLFHVQSAVNLLEKLLSIGLLNEQDEPKDSAQSSIPDKIRVRIDKNSPLPPSGVESASADSETNPKPERQKSDSVYRALSDAAVEMWGQKYRGKPGWTQKHYVQLAALRKRLPELTVAEFSRRYRIYLDSTDEFWAKQNGSLAVFCSNFDRFVKATGWEADL